MHIAELKGKLSEIKRRGYVVSLRGGNTGIGYTLEILLGLVGSNLGTPDLVDIELKSRRTGANNRITMFTFNRGVWRIKQEELIEKYGYIDTNGRASLYCIANSSPNNQGILVKVEQAAVRLYHLDGTFVAEWPGSDLMDRFRSKMPTLVIVSADTRINSEGKEEFWYKEAYLLTEPNEDNFLELIRTDAIVVDVRMHLKEDGGVRNHGTAFRIDEKFWHLCFGRREKLI